MGSLHDDRYKFCDRISRSSSWNDKCFSPKFVGKIKTHILSLVTFFKWCRLQNNVEKYCKAGQASDDDMAHAHCVLGN